MCGDSQTVPSSSFWYSVSGSRIAAWAVSSMGKRRCTTQHSNGFHAKKPGLTFYEILVDFLGD